MNHTSTTPIAIAARPEVRFDFTWTPAIHHANNPYLSHFWNALSIMTPATERVLIRITRSLRDEVTDERIRTDIDALVMQEALHTREHRRLNTRFERLRGPLPEPGSQRSCLGQPVAVLAMPGRGPASEALGGALLIEPTAQEAPGDTQVRLMNVQAQDAVTHLVAHLPPREPGNERSPGL